MAATPRSLRRNLTLLLAVGVFLATAQPATAATKKPQIGKAGKPAATQTIDLGNVGEKARVDIKQVQGVDPKELAKVLDMLAKRDADARLNEERVAKLAQRAAELEQELKKARESGVSRVLAQAAQPEVDDLAKRARAALLKGDSVLAEQLLRQQEDRAVAAAEKSRHEAAVRAREIAALAFGRDSKTALAALERAAKYEPEDSWTQVQLGDAKAVLGQSKAAMASYKTAQSIAEALAARDPANTEWQRDLSVSHEKIGDVLVAQGDGPGALAAYRKSHDIFEALAARDPANTQWQRDLSVSHEKIGDVLVAQGDGPGALAASART
jgi:tetratricopeptide (TPR) repeat protein